MVAKECVTSAVRAPTAAAARAASQPAWPPPITMTSNSRFMESACSSPAEMAQETGGVKHPRVSRETAAYVRRPRTIRNHPFPGTGPVSRESLPDAEFRKDDAKHVFHAVLSGYPA
ncbi:MAG: hypothetical protein Kow0026_24460 [Oricola sp.]